MTTKRVANRHAPPNKEMIRGWFHGKLVPPISNGKRKLRIVSAMNNAPRKSMRARLLFFGSVLGPLPVCAGNVIAIRPIAMPVSGAWPRKDHRQPTVSASQPPSGPPMLRPVVATMLTYERHDATSRNGIRSVMRIDTRAVIPEEPNPEMTLPRMR